VSPRWRAASGVLFALACAVGVGALHRVFVATRRGQLVDQATLVGGATGRRFTLEYADAVLDVVSGLAVLLVVALVVVIGLVRRRVAVAAAAAVLVVGPTVTTQVLKRWVLDRADLIGEPGPGNSLPSGHTAFAAAVSVALLVVVPTRLRPAVAVAGAAYTTATGVATLAAGWHRASDAVAAVLVVGAWAALVAVVMPAPEEEQAPADRGRSSGHRPALVVLGAGAVLGAAGSLVVVAVLASRVPPVAQGRGELALAYAGGAAGVAGAACAVLLAAMVLRRPLARPVRALG